VVVEHPTGRTECVVELGDDGAVARAGMLRTARKLMEGVVFAYV
jgi:4-oxalomesaconate tautomerase